MNASTGTGGANKRYQLVLIGELLPGHDLDGVVMALAEVFTTPEVQLRRLFDGNNHRVAQDLTADRALELQEHLQRAGIHCRIEKVPQEPVPLVLRDGESPAVWRDEPTPVRVLDGQGLSAWDVAPPPPPVASQSSGHAERRWQDAWANSHVEEESDDDESLALFAGPRGLRYLDRFRRVSNDGRPVLRPSWNWGAFVSPFLWALYRKLWGWALVIGLTEVIIPLVLWTLARHGELPPAFATLALLSVLGNRLFWPLIADYLYYRHAQAMVGRLFGMTHGYASDLDVSSAGGVSRAAVLVGTTFSAVLALLLWSLVGSVQDVANNEFEAQASVLLSRPSLQGQGVEAEVLNAQRDDNRWAETRRKLRELGQVVNEWMASRAVSGDPGELSLFRLREDMQIGRQMLLDGWGMEVQYLADNEGYRLVSAGPDKLFGTADDILYRRILTQ
jgi:hypothetical protein